MKLAYLIVFCREVRSLAEWYQRVLGMKIHEIEDGWAILDGIALHGGGRKRTGDCGHKLVFGARDVKRRAKSW